MDNLVSFIEVYCKYFAVAYKNRYIFTLDHPKLREAISYPDGIELIFSNYKISILYTDELSQTESGYEVKSGEMTLFFLA